MHLIYYHLIIIIFRWGVPGYVADSEVEVHQRRNIVFETILYSHWNNMNKYKNFRKKISKIPNVYNSKIYKILGKQFKIIVVIAGSKMKQSGWS